MRLEDIEVVDDPGIDENTEEMQGNDSIIDNVQIYNEIFEYVPESSKKLFYAGKVLKILAAICSVFDVFSLLAQMWIAVVGTTIASIIFLITGFLFDAIADITTNTARTNALIALQTKMML